MNIEDMSLEHAQVMFDLPRPADIHMSVEHPHVRRLALSRLGPTASSFWWVAYDMSVAAFAPVPIADVFTVLGVGKMNLGMRALTRLSMFKLVTSVDPGIVTMSPCLPRSVPTHIANNVDMPAAQRGLAIDTLHLWNLDQKACT